MFPVDKLITDEVNVNRKKKSGEGGRETSFASLMQLRILRSFRAIDYLYSRKK